MLEDKYEGSCYQSEITLAKCKILITSKKYDDALDEISRLIVRINLKELVCKQNAGFHQLLFNTGVSLFDVRTTIAEHNSRSNQHIYRKKNTNKPRTGSVSLLSFWISTIHQTLPKCTGLDICDKRSGTVAQFNSRWCARSCLGTFDLEKAQEFLDKAEKQEPNSMCTHFVRVLIALEIMDDTGLYKLAPQD